MQHVHATQGRSSRRRSQRRVTAALAGISVLAGALLAVVPVALITASPAEARYATGGTGAYKGSIDWFEWGTHGQAIPAGGTTRTNTRTVAGGELATTCSISNLTGQLAAYRSGSWSGDGLDDLYNIPNGAGQGTGANNQLVAGLSTATGGNPVFDLSCSVTLDGSAVPLAGLVMADAEQSGPAEYVQATIPAGAEWRLIDRTRTAGCNADIAVTRTGQTLRMTGPAVPCGAGPDGVAFMDGATSARVTLKGGGVSAIALGVMLFNDFGDAPASYGDAGALYSPGFAGGTVPEGASTLYGSTLSTPTQPVTRLGATVDSEPGQQSGATAVADGADEDAIATPVNLRPTPGSPYTLPGVACTGPGVVSGWIDWNGNGSFEAGERSDQPSCTGSSVDLTWDVPARPDTGPTFLRLRIGPNAAAVAGPTGVITAGEVEDYAAVVAPRADYGDAPDTAGTTAASNGARHLVPGYDADGNTAPAMLGARIDLDDDGAAGPAADGDDNTGVDDEDGVDFNTSLGYPSQVLRTGTDAVTLEPVVNTLDVSASRAGFVSVWVDLNGDGDFTDPGEREVDAAPVVAGSNAITFTESVNPPDIRALVRVRFSTDASAIHSPTGVAPDGEVEDYRPLVERLIVPAACAPVSESFYAMTFLSIQELTPGTGTRGAARYPNVTVVGGRPVDMIIQRTGGNALGNAGFFRGGDDAAWQLNAGGGLAQITYSFVEAGTTTSIAVNAVWTFNDQDSGEMAQIQKSALAGFAVTPGSKVVILRGTDLDPLHRH